MAYTPKDNPLLNNRLVPERSSLSGSGSQDHNPNASPAGHEAPKHTSPFSGRDYSKPEPTKDLVLGKGSMAYIHGTGGIEQRLTQHLRFHPEALHELNEDRRKLHLSPIGAKDIPDFVDKLIEEMPERFTKDNKLTAGEADSYKAEREWRREQNKLRLEDYGKFKEKN